MSLFRIAFCALLLFFSVGLYAQDISITNGSFEGFAQQGRNDQSFRLEGWQDCGPYQFRLASPPDVHQGVNRDTSFWENENRSSHGKTYLGLVVRDNESWESVSQRLPSALKAGTCYKMSISLARSRTYKSHTSSNRDVPSNFTEPAVLRVWGGSGICDCDSQLLAESSPVSNNQWENFEFKLEPDSNFPFITVEAFYETPLLFPYNGHILLDKMSDLTVVDCEEEIIVERKEVKKAPPHKAIKKAPVVDRDPTKVDTIVAKAPIKEKIMSLDRKKMTAGTKIKIEKLFFDADTSSLGVSSYEVLNEIYDFLSENGDITIEIGGHTNNVPPHEYCNKLSSERAQAVASYLIAKGIEPNRITSKGYGKRRPIASNRTPEGRKNNQRVEIKIISIG